MRKAEENDIGKLLHKMRERQSNIRKSLDYDVSKYSRKPMSVSSSNAPASSSLSTSCSTSSFETRLQRIRGIRKKFEDKYSILRQSNNDTLRSQSVGTESGPELATSTTKPCRPHSARMSIDSLHQNVDLPLTARDDLHIQKHQNNDLFWKNRPEWHCSCYSNTLLVKRGSKRGS